MGNVVEVDVVVAEVLVPANVELVLLVDVDVVVVVNPPGGWTVSLKLP
jgi:hypothetical protein